MSAFALIPSAYAQMAIRTPGVDIEWGWTDWVGVCLFLIVLAFIITGGIAIMRGANALSVMAAFGKAVRDVLRIRR